MSSGPEQLPLFVAQAEVRAEVTRRRIVVLPFRNLSQQPADNWLSESFSESLMMGLSQSPGLRLIERSEIQAVLKEQALMQSVLADPAQAPQLGQLMGAEYIVVGHFQRIESQLQAQVRLVNVSTGEVASASMTQVRGQMRQAPEQAARYVDNDPGARADERALYPAGTSGPPVAAASGSKD